MWEQLVLLYWVSALQNIFPYSLACTHMYLCVCVCVCVCEHVKTSSGYIHNKLQKAFIPLAFLPKLVSFYPNILTKTNLLLTFLPHSLPLPFYLSPFLLSFLPSCLHLFPQRELSNNYFKEELCPFCRKLYMIKSQQLWLMCNIGPDCFRNESEILK